MENEVIIDSNISVYKEDKAQEVMANVASGLSASQTFTIQNNGYDYITEPNEPIIINGVVICPKSQIIIKCTTGDNLTISTDGTNRVLSIFSHDGILRSSDSKGQVFEPYSLEMLGKQAKGEVPVASASNEIPGAPWFTDTQKEIALMAGLVIGGTALELSGTVLSTGFNQSTEVAKEAFLRGVFSKMGYTGKTLYLLSTKLDALWDVVAGGGDLDGKLSETTLSNEEKADVKGLFSHSVFQNEGMDVIREGLGKIYIPKSADINNKALKTLVAKGENATVWLGKLGEKTAGALKLNKAIIAAENISTLNPLKLLKGGRGFLLADMAFSASTVGEGIDETITNYSQSKEGEGYATVVSGAARVSTDAIVLGASFYTAAATFGAANIWNPVGIACLITCGVAAGIAAYTGKSPGQLVSEIGMGSTNNIVQNISVEPVKSENIISATLSNPSNQVAQETTMAKIPVAYGMVAREERNINTDGNWDAQILGAVYKQFASNYGEVNNINDSEKAKLKYLSKILTNANIEVGDKSAVVTEKIESGNKYNNGDIFNISANSARNSDVAKYASEDVQVIAAIAENFLKDGKLSPEEKKKILEISEHLSGVKGFVTFDEVNNKVFVWDKSKGKTFEINNSPGK